MWELWAEYERGRWAFRGGKSKLHVAEGGRCQVMALVLLPLQFLCGVGAAGTFGLLDFGLVRRWLKVEELYIFFNSHSFLYFPSVLVAGGGGSCGCAHLCALRRSQFCLQSLCYWDGTF